MLAKVGAEVRRAGAMARAMFASALAAALSALTWFFLMAGAGAALIVFGVLQLAGFGWACIAGGVFLLVGAAFVRKAL